MVNVIVEILGLLYIVTPWISTYMYFNQKIFMVFGGCEILLGCGAWFFVSKWGYTSSMGDWLSYNSHGSHKGPGCFCTKRPKKEIDRWDTGDIAYFGIPKCSREGWFVDYVLVYMNDWFVQKLCNLFVFLFRKSGQEIFISHPYVTDALYHRALVVFTSYASVLL